MKGCSQATTCSAALIGARDGLTISSFPAGSVFPVCVPPRPCVIPPPSCLSFCFPLLLVPPEERRPHQSLGPIAVPSNLSPPAHHCNTSALRASSRQGRLGGVWTWQDVACVAESRSGARTAASAHRRLVRTQKRRAGAFFNKKACTRMCVYHTCFTTADVHNTVSALKTCTHIPNSPLIKQRTAGLQDSCQESSRGRCKQHAAAQPVAELADWWSIRHRLYAKGRQRPRHGGLVWRVVAVWCRVGSAWRSRAPRCRCFCCCRRRCGACIGSGTMAQPVDRGQQQQSGGATRQRPPQPQQQQR